MTCETTFTIEMLNEARKAYHNLMTGAAVVEVHDQNGDRVVFQRMDSNKLYQYIQRIEAALYPDCSPAAVSGPLGFFF